MLKLFVAFAGVLLVLHNVSAQCDCYCKCEGLFGSAEEAPKAPLVVRPQALPRPSVARPILGNSNAGPCFRRKAIVKPALIAKNVYVPTPVASNPCECSNAAAVASALAAAANALSSSSSCSSSTGYTQTTKNTASSSSCSSNLQGCQPIDYDAAYKQYCSGSTTQSTVPADAVSIALAYRRSQKPFGYVNEDKLSFGFRKLPVDEIQPPKCTTEKVTERRTVIGNVNEENLYSLNGQIVELKPVRETVQECSEESLAEEAADELLDLEAEECSETLSSSGKVQGPSLSELGYAPTKNCQKQFINVPYESSEETQTESACTTEAVCKKCKGFKSGTVEYKTYAKPKYIAINQEDNTSCESQEGPADNIIRVPQPMCSCSCPKNAGSQMLNSYVSHQSKSSKSSSSSSSCHQSCSQTTKTCGRRNY